MAKSSYSVKPADIFGRIGSGIGQGIADTLPKEIERGRKVQGLQQFEQEAGNLTPLQTLARLSAIPGITPQEIQSFGELAKQQQVRNAYQNYAGRSQGGVPQAGRGQGQPSVRQQFQEQADAIPFAGIQQGRAASPTNAPSARAGEPIYGTTSEINPENPLGGQFAEIPPWTPERRNQEIAEILGSGLAQTAGEAQQIAAANEAAERGAPGTAKENQNYLNQVRERARNELTRQIQTATQKQGADVYKDLTGETLLNLERNIEKDLRENPKASEQEVVRKWIDKGLNFAKSKPLLDTLAGRDSWDFLFKHGQTLDKLKGYQKTYADMNAEEEFYNKLKASNVPATPGTPAIKGFGMSPQGAAQIAFPRSKSALSVITKYNPKNDNSPTQNAEMLAAQIAKNLDEKDSLLAIARDLTNKDPIFDQNAFFNYFRNNEVALTPRQRRDIEEGESDIFPSWGDEWINFRRLK
jgi:hypothetical protein